MKKKETLWDRVSERMEQFGLTQQQLAERSGLAQTSISKLQRTKKPRLLSIQALAQALGVSPEWLATGEGDKDSTEKNPPKSPDQELLRQVRALKPRSRRIVEETIRVLADLEEKAALANEEQAINNPADKLSDKKK